MGFFSDLFGGGSKTDFGALLPDPPELRIDDADLFLDQIDDLISTFDRRRTGSDQFDFVRFLFEPQARRLDREFGLGAPGTLTDLPNRRNDLFARGGILPRTLQRLNATGNLDAGTAAAVSAQLESELARQKDDAFSEAKILQRQDIDNALANLERLFPTRFEVRNIPNVVAFQNDLARFNAESERNIATESARKERRARKNKAISDLIGSSAPFLAAIPGVGPFLSAGASILGSGGNQSSFASSLFRPQRPSPQNQSSIPQISVARPLETSGSRVGATTPGIGNIFQPRVSGLNQRLLGVLGG